MYSEHAQFNSKMRNCRLVMLVAAASGALGHGICRCAITPPQAEVFVGQDLRFSGPHLLSHDRGGGRYTLVFQEGFSMSVGANRYSSDAAVVELETTAFELAGRVRVEHRASVYLQGAVTVKKGPGASTVELSEDVLEKGRGMVVRATTAGEVFVTAEKHQVGDPGSLQIYEKALACIKPVEPRFVVRPEALVPSLPQEAAPQAPAAAGTVRQEPGGEQAVAAAEATAEAEAPKPRFRYPVNIAPAGEAVPQIHAAKADELDVATIIGRFYLWQKQDEEGRLLELQADNGVVFYVGGELDVDHAGSEDVLASGSIRAIYMSGDVIMTEGRRSVTADEIYYDFRDRKALAINGTLKNFDVSRGIPIYVRADEVRQVAENKFSAENITLTTSEFHLPQVSMTASSVVVTDTTTVDEQAGRLSDASYEAEMRDIRLKTGKTTLFRWPFLRSDLQRPDVPIKSTHFSHSSTWGTSLETRWYLARLLGLKEPAGTDSTLALDYYGKRGLGTGAEIDYTRENSYGTVLAYLINDHGDDRLGRASDRRNVEPPRDLRGRFRWQHRHYLPYQWQLTSEVSYASDENFIEGYYRNEFDVGKEQETLVHLKRIENNWGVSVLNKLRINDFVSKLEELPSVEFHLTGQSLFDDRFTLYSDSYLSRLRQRLASGGPDEQFFTFLSERAELDLPVSAGSFNVVPFVAGTAGFEDGLGFRTDIEGDSVDGEDAVWLGEGGLRASTRYWKLYPGVESRLWDLRQLRHIVKPQVQFVGFAESDRAIEQRDVINLGLSQRLQTKRGGAAEGSESFGAPERVVDWMRLDTDITWVDESAEPTTGPDRFIWNRPFVPLLNTATSAVPARDRRGLGLWGARRNYIGADYIWRITDTSAILSDMNYDTASGVVQQFNVGFSRLCWPDLSYYVGSRYLKRVWIDGEEGSNAFTFAATYRLDPRYTLVFSQQYDFDYGAGIRNDMTLLRRYHRVYWAITYSADHSLDDEALVISIWPQGVPEFALGTKRYMGLGPAVDD